MGNKSTGKLLLWVWAKLFGEGLHLSPGTEHGSSASLCGREWERIPWRGLQPWRIGNNRYGTWRSSCQSQNNSSWERDEMSEVQVLRTSGSPVLCVRGPAAHVRLDASLAQGAQCTPHRMLSPHVCFSSTVSCFVSHCSNQRWGVIIQWPSAPCLLWPINLKAFQSFSSSVSSLSPCKSLEIQAGHDLTSFVWI